MPASVRRVPASSTTSPGCPGPHYAGAHFVPTILETAGPGGREESWVVSATRARGRRQGPPRAAFADDGSLRAEAEQVPPTPAPAPAHGESARRREGAESPPFSGSLPGPWPPRRSVRLEAG